MPYATLKGQRMSQGGFLSMRAALLELRKVKALALPLADFLARHA